MKSIALALLFVPALALADAAPLFNQNCAPLGSPTPRPFSSAPRPSGGLSVRELVEYIRALAKK